SANLKMIGTAMYTYGNENNEDWPMMYDVGDLKSNKPLRTVDYTQAIGAYRSVDVNTLPTPPAKVSTTRNLWMLVHNSSMTPRAFICPSSNDVPNSENNPESYWDFGPGGMNGVPSPTQAATFWKQCSYGYQVPYGKYGRPSSDRDARMVLAADKGPFGTAIDG